MPPTILKLMGGGVDLNLPNVSYCKDVKDVHYTPYNLVRFYVGEISGTTPQTVKIYTDKTNHIDVTVSEGNKWHTYVLPKDKGLSRIESGTYDEDNEEWSNGIVTKTVIKANITANSMPYIIPYSTVEASFKGSDTSNVTDMRNMFSSCSGLTSLDVSSFNTNNVTTMSGMFEYCFKLTSLDLSNFDTSNVTDMRFMFGNCSGLKSLDVSSFDTSKVTCMIHMFEDCSKLTSLDLSGWVINDATDTGNMFNACDALEEIKMVGCTQDTINKIKAQLTTDLISIDKVNIITE